MSLKQRLTKLEAAIAAAQLEAEQRANVPRPSLEEFEAAERRLYEKETGEPAPDIPTPEPDSNGKWILDRSLYGRDDAGIRTIKGYSRDGDGSWVRD